MNRWVYSVSIVLFICVFNVTNCNLQQFVNDVFTLQMPPNLNEGHNCNTTIRPIVLLLNYIAEKYFRNNCYTILLYDDFFYFNVKYSVILEELLSTFPMSITHGRIVSVNTKHYIFGKTLKSIEANCKAYIVLTKDVEAALDIIGPQPDAKVVIVPQASQWQINTFLMNTVFHIVNLLVIADPSLQIEEYETKNKSLIDITMYTQRLYIDSMGASTSKLVTAWRCNRVTRPEIDLFPRKFSGGFNGYSFRLTGAQQPPYVYRKRNQFVSRKSEERITTWDGNEMRLIRLIATLLNFTITIKESEDSKDDSAKRVLKDLEENKADIAIAGIPLTAERNKKFTFSTVHSHDCANFVSLTSTALPKYRAIMGPFQLGVWLSIIAIYIFAIFPIAFSAKRTLKPLLTNPGEIENMFWYVFGTFTNCFTFTGKGSWTGGNHSSTRIFIGIYWVFTIIITAAYTGCIIAFIMLPAYPTVVNSAKDLVKKNYRIGILNGSGWELTFKDADDPITSILLKEADFVPSMEIGLRNVTKSIYRRPYAFLGSKEELKYLIKTNFTPNSRHKKSVFHLSKDCFIPMMLSIAFPKKSMYASEMDLMMTRVVEHGFFVKLSKDVEWDQYRSSTGRLLEVTATNLRLGSPDDRQLTLDDTQGMFLLYGVGVGAGFAILLLECYLSVHKKIKRCIQNVTVKKDIVSKNPSILVTSHNGLTPYFGSRVSPVQSAIYGSAFRLLQNQLSTSLFELNNIQHIKDNNRRNSFA